MEKTETKLYLPITDEFVHHFDVCNQSWFRHKKLFYKLKTIFLRHFCKFDGYDVQGWNKWRVEIYDSIEYMTDPEYDELCKKPYYQAHANECPGADWVSWHEHILERYCLKDKVYHVPNGQYYFSNWQERIDETEQFFEQKEQAKNKLPLLKKCPVNHHAFESLKFLIHYFNTKV